MWSLLTALKPPLQPLHLYDLSFESPFLFFPCCFLPGSHPVSPAPTCKWPSSLSNHPFWTYKYKGTHEIWQYNLMVFIEFCLLFKDMTIFICIVCITTPIWLSIISRKICDTNQLSLRNNGSKWFTMLIGWSIINTAKKWLVTLVEDF